MSAPRPTKCENPIREAQNGADFKAYDSPTGGWGALQAEEALSADPTLLRLATIRSRDQYSSTAIYSLNDRYRGVFGGRRLIFRAQGIQA